MIDRRVAHEAVITGVGMITPFGDDGDLVAGAVAAGLAGFREVADKALIDAGVDPCRAAPVSAFATERYFGDGNVRPLDRTARLAAAAAKLALEASGWGDRAQRNGQEVGLVLGTMFGSLNTIASFDLRAQRAGPSYAKPLDFANSVINAAAGQTAIWHGLRGVNSTVAGGPSAGLRAISIGAEMIARGRARALLVGGAEELSHQAWIGLSRGGRLARAEGSSGPIAVPFAADRNGFMLGEGAGLLALERQADAEARGAHKLATIRGYGSAFDPSRGVGVEGQADALARAIRQALASAALAPTAVDLVSCSASGDPSRDLAEARAIESVLGADRPVMAIKANLGESLGAAGALQTVMALLALEREEVPGIAGLVAVDPAIPLCGLSARAHSLTAHIVLITALGIDGNAEAVVLSGGDR